MYKSPCSISPNQGRSRSIGGKLAKNILSTKEVSLTPKYVRWEDAHGKENDDCKACTQIGANVILSYSDLWILILKFESILYRLNSLNKFGNVVSRDVIKNIMSPTKAAFHESTCQSESPEYQLFLVHVVKMVWCRFNVGTSCEKTSKNVSGLLQFLRDFPQKKLIINMWGPPENLFQTLNPSKQPGCPEKGKVSMQPTLLNPTKPYVLNIGGCLARRNFPPGKAPCPQLMRTRVSSPQPWLFFVGVCRQGHFGIWKPSLLIRWSPDTAPFFMNE